MRTAPQAEQLLTIQEAATRWGVSRDTIERLVREGEIDAVRIAARRRITVSSMQAYIDRQRIDQLRERSA